MPNPPLNRYPLATFWILNYRSDHLKSLRRPSECLSNSLRSFHLNALCTDLTLPFSKAQLFIYFFKAQLFLCTRLPPPPCLNYEIFKLGLYLESAERIKG